MSTLFKGVYYYLAILLIEYTIQGSSLIKGAYYLRKYGTLMRKSINGKLAIKKGLMTTMMLKTVGFLLNPIMPGQRFFPNVM